jgi:hypothetical protein
LFADFDLCIEYILSLICIFSDALLGARVTTEVTLAPKPLAQKLPSTPYEDVHEVEEMVNSMLRDSPTLDAEKDSEKLPEEGEGEKRPRRPPQVSLLRLFSDVLSLLFYWFW